MSDYVIEVNNLRKRFCRSLKRSLVYGTMDVARGMLGLADSRTELRTSEFWALDQISFRLKRGESLGLIGANGCGKSTLLRLLSGIFPPDDGEIHIRGRMASLIAVGAGFHPHMSGAENIYLNGILLGLTRDELNARFDEIVEFAEIGEFIEAPVSTYSSGMRVRLGFSIAVHIRPEILLVDEVMSVGDTRFRRKASAAMSALLETGNTTLVLVSHNAFAVRQQCDYGLVMDHGKQLFMGPVHEAYELYQDLQNQLEIKRTVDTDYENFHVISSAGTDVIVANEPFEINFSLRPEVIVTRTLPITIIICDSDNVPVLSLQPDAIDFTIHNPTRFQVGGLNLRDGTYFITCKVGSQFHGSSLLEGHRVTVQGNPRMCNTAVWTEMVQIDA